MFKERETEKMSFSSHIAVSKFSIILWKTQFSHIAVSKFSLKDYDMRDYFSKSLYKVALVLPKNIIRLKYLQLILTFQNSNHEWRFRITCFGEVVG